MIVIYELMFQRAGCLTSTHPVSNRVLRAERGFFLRSGGRAILVAVFEFLEQVWKTVNFRELENKTHIWDFKVTSDYLITFSLFFLVTFKFGKFPNSRALFSLERDCQLNCFLSFPASSQLRWTYGSGYVDVGVRQALLGAVLKTSPALGAVHCQQVASHVSLRCGNLCWDTTLVSPTFRQQWRKRLT